MKFIALTFVGIVSILALAALFSRRHVWLRTAAIWVLTFSALSTISLTYLFGLRSAVAVFERAGGRWTNELAAAFLPFVHNVVHPFYLLLSVWVILLAMLALKRGRPG